ncbi:MAG TPA: CopD family protein [Burkholderiaceae bacterium]|nr:CopD family protein [Burkholderiaceae bacterium]
MNLELPLELCAAVHAGSLMIWFGALSLHRILGVVQRDDEQRALRVAAAVALGSGVLWPFLQTGVARDDAAAAIDPQLVAQLLTQTSFGRTWLVRQVFVLLALLVTWVPLLQSGRAVYFLVAGALASIALLGHAAGVTGASGTVQRLTLALHLLAAGAWLGALPRLWSLTDDLPVADLAQVLRRFSPYGIVLVSIVVITGTLSAWFRIGTAELLLSSAYGKILLGKVALVALMGLAALNNRNRQTPALERPDLLVQAAARRGLRRSIAVETTLGIAVVLVAALLGAAEAPR